jgi:hypothetical protein
LALSNKKFSAFLRRESIHKQFRRDFGMINKSFQNNSVVGAVVNLVVDGYHGGTVDGNVLAGAQGSFSFFKGNCAYSGNYAVAHTDGTCLQGGFSKRSFHYDSCEETGESIDNPCAESPCGRVPSRPYAPGGPLPPTLAFVVVFGMAMSAPARSPARRAPIA